MGGVLRTTLAAMQPGQAGTIVEVQGGRGLADRLASLGIMPGRKVTKVSGMILRGPVTIAVGRTQVAVGFGMASKIVVEAE